MSDKFDQEAEELLPWEQFSYETVDEDTWKQLITTIAARLRVDGEIIKTLRSAVDDGYRGAYNKARSEFAAKLIQK